MKILMVLTSHDQLGDTRRAGLSYSFGWNAARKGT